MYNIVNNKNYPNIIVSFEKKCAKIFIKECFRSLFLK